MTESSQIRAVHNAAVRYTKKALFTAQQDFISKENIQQQAQEKEDILNAYDAVLESMANVHLARPQSEELVTKAKEELQQQLKLIKSKLFSGLEDHSDEEEKEGLNQSLDKISKELSESLVAFGPRAINTYKAKLSLHNDQLKNKKTDAHLTAKVFDPESFSPDPMEPVDHSYKIDIDKLRLHIKHNLAKLKPGEKLHIEIEIPPDRADILKKVAETGFQYRISLVALLLLLFIQIKMINKDDETRVASAVKELIEKDHIPMSAEDITFSIKARGNDGKMQTVLEPRSLDPAVAAWKVSKSLKVLYNILYPAARSKNQIDESKEKKLPSSCQQEVGVGLNANVMRC